MSGVQHVKEFLKKGWLQVGVLDSFRAQKLTLGAL